MAAYLNSTAATDGSANDFPRLPSTLTSSPTPTTEAIKFASILAAIDANSPNLHAQPSTSSSCATPNTLELPRTISWLNNPVEGQPRYTYTCYESVDAHIKDVAEYLKSFDDIMAKK
ncbi:uncharacterized protein LY89DRAFT_670884 [Mollisia scopiformis]|uniref:Uncharacterized protein n=1 Tax=Mollisia scopiformis TaxID=149040 RepID=A0A194X5G3_MOLSC|nr:uncharacterized protein LY89DRAFT_670884 [Mollisia scopiformis]KUJ15411.1 hypothetical protein LY89DRAFT_670884 [Mollisia scopiformis]